MKTGALSTPTTTTTTTAGAYASPRPRERLWRRFQRGDAVEDARALLSRARAVRPPQPPTEPGGWRQGPTAAACYAPSEPRAERAQPVQGRHVHPIHVAVHRHTGGAWDGAPAVRLQRRRRHEWPTAIGLQHGLDVVLYGRPALGAPRAAQSPIRAHRFVRRVLASRPQRDWPPRTCTYHSAVGIRRRSCMHRQTLPMTRLLLAAAPLATIRCPASSSAAATAPSTGSGTQAKRGFGARSQPLTRGRVGFHWSGGAPHHAAASGRNRWRRGVGHLHRRPERQRHISEWTTADQEYAHDDALWRRDLLVQPLHQPGKAHDCVVYRCARVCARKGGCRSLAANPRLCHRPDNALGRKGGGASGPRACCARALDRLGFSG